MPRRRAPSKTPVPAPTRAVDPVEEDDEGEDVVFVSQKKARLASIPAESTAAQKANAKKPVVKKATAKKPAAKKPAAKKPGAKKAAPAKEAIPVDEEDSTPEPAPLSPVRSRQEPPPMAAIEATPEPTESDSNSDSDAGWGPRDVPPWQRLVRYYGKDAHDYRGAGQKLGQPVDPNIDVGQAVAEKKPVKVQSWWAWNLGDLEGIEVEKDEAPDQIAYLEPLFMEDLDCGEEVMMPQVVHCVGVNFRSFADEAGVEVPEQPQAVSKPDKAVGYHPDRIIVPKAFQKDIDCEAHLAVIIAKSCKNVSPDDALKYVVGITCATNAVSRKDPLQSFKGSCQLGPVIVNRLSIKDWNEVEIQGKLNGKIVQKAKLGEMAFSIPEIISSLSQRTRLKPGTIILTGTPAGAGWYQKPKRALKDGDVFTTTISHGVGSVISQVRFQK